MCKIAIIGVLVLVLARQLPQHPKSESRGPRQAAGERLDFLLLRKDLEEREELPRAGEVPSSVTHFKHS